MPQLIREFELALRTQLGWMTASRQVTSSAPLDALARAFNVLNTAHPELTSAPVLGGFARTLQRLIDRQVAAGRVTLNEFDAATLAAGINHLLELLPRADVSRLYAALQALRNAQRAV